MNNDIEKNLFPTRKEYYPQIYAYKDNNPNHAGLLKIGYTEQKNVEDRIRQQFPVLQPEERPYTIVFSKSSVSAYNEKTLRSTGGMIFNINIITDDLSHVISQIKNDNIKVIGTSLNTSKSLETL